MWAQMSIRFSIVLSEGELLVCHERWHAMKGLLDVGYQLTSTEHNDDQARADLVETIASVPQHIDVFSHIAPMQACHHQDLHVPQIAARQHRAGYVGKGRNA